MKFSQSERQLHQRTYNPPSNAYQIPSKINHGQNIVTGSLAGPSIFTKNTFGYGTRFETNKNNVPGPGTYKTFTKEKTKQQNKKGLTRGTFLYSVQPASVSIPYNYFGQNGEDEEEEEYIKQLQMKEDLLRGVKAMKKNDPAFSFGKSEKKLSYIQHPKKYQHENNYFQEENREINVYKDEQRKSNMIWKDKIKKSSQRRKEIINQINPDFIPSLELIEIMKKRKNKPIPGPGSYGQIDEEDQFFVQLQNKKGVTFTNAQRFCVDQQSAVGPGKYNVLKQKNSSQKFSFGRSKRNTFNDNEDGNFRFYIDNNNEEPAKQRSNSCAFGTTQARFKKVEIEEVEKKQENVKMQKMIKTRIKRHQKLSKETEESEGLLGISTMASTIG